MAMAIDSTDIAARIEQIHETSAVVTAATGRLATAASIMGCLLKGENDTLTLRLSGGGLVGSIIAVSDSKGNVKAYPANPVVELPLNDKGKLDVAGAVGTDGYLSVIRDLGLKEPYIGQTPVSYTHLDVYKRQEVRRRGQHTKGASKRTDAENRAFEAKFITLLEREIP